MRSSAANFNIPKVLLIPWIVLPERYNELSSWKHNLSPSAQSARKLRPAGLLLPFSTLVGLIGSGETTLISQPF